HREHGGCTEKSGIVLGQLGAAQNIQLCRDDFELLRDNPLKGGILFRRLSMGIAVLICRSRRLIRVYRRRSRGRRIYPISLSLEWVSGQRHASPFIASVKSMPIHVYTREPKLAHR